MSVPNEPSLMHSVTSSSTPCNRIKDNKEKLTETDNVLFGIHNVKPSTMVYNFHKETVNAAESTNGIKSRDLSEHRKMDKTEAEKTLISIDKEKQEFKKQTRKIVNAYMNIPLSDADQMLIAKAIERSHEIRS